MTTRVRPGRVAETEEPPIDDTSKVFLAPDVVVEPLFNQWLVDVNLVPPVNAAMTLANSHLKVLRSFVANPKMHAEAARNPKLLGGSFVDVDPSRAEEIKALSARTEEANRELVALTEAVKVLDAMMVADTGGLGLEKLYERVPAPLKGYVELRYDMYHRASPRYLEALLYRSPFYKESSQALGLCRYPDDLRPLGFSTPRLAGADRLLVPLPFRDRRVDALSEARQVSRPLGELAELLGVGADRRELLATFTRPEGPPPRPRFEGPGVRVRYFGHSCLLVESARAAVLVDPTLGYAHGRGIERYSFADLPERIDLVLISHAHGDHLSLEALLALRSRIQTVVVPRSNGGTLVDPTLELLLRQVGFSDVRSVDDLDRVELPGGHAQAIPFLGEHGDLDIRTKASFCIRLEDRNVFAVADAAAVEPRLYDLLKAEVGPVDAMFLAMESHGAPLTWGYGPLFSTPPSRQMNSSRRQAAASFEQVIQIIERIRPRRYYGYAMGWEPWLRHVVAVGEEEVQAKRKETEKVVEHCARLGIPAEMAYGKLELHL